HFYQMQRNEFNNIFTDDERKLAFEQRETNLRIDAGVYPYFEGNSYLDDNILTSRGCGDHLNSITFVAVNKITGKAIPNLRQEGNKGTYNSVDPRCSNNIDKKYLFDYFYNQQSYRHAAANFFDSLPNNTIIGLWNYGSVGYASNPRFIDEWQNDTLVYGPNKSLYHKFKEAGFTLIDSFYRNVPFIAIIEKDENGQLITREQHIGSDPTDFLEARYYFDRYLTNGTLKSMTVGPANEWKSIHWKTSAADASESDSTIFRLYGVRSDFSETLLYQSQDPAKDTTLDFVDAVWYPRLRLEYYAVDEVNHTPRMLDYWQIKYDEIPEGALSANLFFQNRDTVEVGETIDFKIAFKNISQAPFDSLKLKMIIIDQHNVTHVIDLPRAKPLMSGDTVLVSYLIDTKKFPGNNTLYLEVNGDGDQVEQHYFNNFLYREIYVKPDYTQPLLDVTFDGVHILNRDIVSSKPHIMIKLKDDAKYMPLTDTAGISVQLRYMENGGWTRKYSFDGDTLRFTPPANSLVDNTATIDFLPHLLEDGEYELTVSGNDMSENAAGSLDYRVVFQVYNKPMISNMLNYPNPFTTSTAFVFTITGEEVPQNLKIQILTVTGKVVREITKNELGPLRVGRNITEYKWDGTDQFGQKLGNGIYLYRVVTNLNGKSLDKFQYENDKTDKYFRQGYGKMYLMR
ncbi:MAG TPA: FlgD immunoglobulin-like domain containing protein, partial [Parasegetibacter sp.]